MKKTVLVVVCMLVISLILMVPAASDHHESSDALVAVQELNIPGRGVCRQGRQMENHFVPASYHLGIDSQITSGEDDEEHPTIAIGSTQQLLAGYEAMTTGVDKDIWLSSSTDGGDTWMELGHLFPQMDETIETYPSFDHQTDGRAWGTFTPDPDDDQGGIEYLFEAPDITDPNTWNLYWWVWGTWYNCTLRGTSEIACDTYDGMNPWEYGVIAFTHTGIDDGTVNCPVINYADHPQELYGWYYFWYLDDCANASCEIDRTTDMVYAVYDWYNTTSGVRDIVYLKDDFTAMWPYGPGASLFHIESTANNVCPTVAADDDNVMIIVETDENANQDIICYYSSNGGQTWDVSAVADSGVDEISPDVVSNGDLSATCTFLKDGDLYYTTTEDGGDSWSTAEKVNDEDGEVVMEYRAEAVCEQGTVWMDTRDGNSDIYFDVVGTAPLLTIEEIAGGFGVSAAVKNIGTANATDVEWNISFEGGIVIPKQKKGTISVLEPGYDEPIRSIIIGIGRPTITFYAESAEDVYVSEEASGFVLLFFVLGLS
jgi:hypothetical protein